MSGESGTKIEDIRHKMGGKLSILAHHYQHDSIVRHADYIGDSLELARKIPNLEAEYIVLCGVFFMAESAAILAHKGQKVYIPDREAGCLLAGTSPASYLERVIKAYTSSGKSIIPLAYVNTSAAIKALCGLYGGSVCTSANARIMLDWARNQGQAVLFLPDKNLGQNTADQLGLNHKDQEIIHLQEPYFSGEVELYIWPGLCVIHHFFKTHHIAEVRERFPAAYIIVHPECSPEVVQASDASGSTSQIIQYVQELPKDSQVFVGTEINMVSRLKEQFQGDKDVLPLISSACSNMAKITEIKLADLLEYIDEVPPIEIDRDIQEQAWIALERMLSICL
ncbi:MAG TPA: quinolinate synthase NadA [Desulfohalobiaceae bacterium]|nr:quinolinate synthase NadA [Desulfohalobiaceae bacterium]